MSDEELIARLRDADLYNAQHYERDPLHKQAADRIEALTEQLEAARADAKEAEAYAEELEKEKREAALDALAAHGQASDAYEAQLEAEAKLAKAVELLELAVIRWDEHQKYGMGISGDWVEEARTTLAEIEGEKT